MGATRRARHSRYPCTWFALGAVSGWLSGFLAGLDHRTTPSRWQGVDGLAIQVYAMIGVGLFQATLCMLWIGYRRQQPSWPEVCFVLPLLSGLLQVCSMLPVAATVPLVSDDSPMVPIVAIASWLGGPALAGEIVLRRSGLSTRVWPYPGPTS